MKRSPVYPRQNLSRIPVSDLIGELERRSDLLLVAFEKWGVLSQMYCSKGRDACLDLALGLAANVERSSPSDWEDDRLWLFYQQPKPGDSGATMSEVGQQDATAS